MHMDVKQGLIGDKVGRRKKESKMIKIAGKSQKSGFRVVLIFTKVLIFLSTVFTKVLIFLSTVQITASLIEPKILFSLLILTF